MDFADHAQRADEQARAAALARRAVPAKEGATHCERCGEEIPAARRAAIGARLCVECQTALERLRR
ncbi:TraR/DksA C4-type zinc finger protein [Pseudoroseomonas cervicalis]|uniref:Phage/conjugal plasmid C-4 type zinc finger protein, TraR family n=1 Tax=Pseudoroseomonas cervicalis ATCC 49957 TaxID=525371 RepID=D5RM63_9PROT|nr:TraR/DksA C4-type zinc finger protein [Pseudoroseomonas cervicalis]EFH11615.1 phage/conjugal plasmid C-4 type zinc finger protein, TraR family [Pseudoroseomonas cervicalis ATCC 49957]